MAEQKGTSRSKVLGEVLGALAMWAGPLAFFVMATVAKGFESFAVMLFFAAPLLVGGLVGRSDTGRGWLTAGALAVALYVPMTWLLHMVTDTITGQAHPLTRLPLAVVAVLVGAATATLGGWLGGRLRESPSWVKRWWLVWVMGLCLLYTGGRNVLSGRQAEAFKRSHLPRLLAQVNRDLVSLPPDLQAGWTQCDAAEGTVSVVAGGDPDGAQAEVRLAVDQWPLLRGKVRLRRVLWYAGEGWDWRGDPLTPEEAAARLEAAGVRPRLVRMMREKGRVTERGTRAGRYPGTMARPYLVVTRKVTIVAVGRHSTMLVSDPPHLPLFEPEAP